MFASRTKWDLRPNKIAQKAEQLQKAGIGVLDLTQSNPTACGIEYPSGFLDALQNPQNACYEPLSQGLEPARKALASDSSRVVLTASTSEAYSFLMRLLVEPGEQVLFPQPSYPLLDHLAQLSDVEVGRYWLRYDGGWRLDFDSLERAVTSRTRAIVVIHPNNPTGSFLKRDEIEWLNDLCRKKNLALISDEVFGDYAFGADNGRASSLVANGDVLTFALGGISKMLGLPQMKLAWIHVGGEEKLRKDALERLLMIADTYLSVNTPVQNALPAWLAGKEEFQRPIKERIAANWRRLNAADWKSAGCEVLQAEGGWYAVLRVPRTRSEEEWALELLTQKHVLVHPGYFFDFEKEAYLVLSLLPTPDGFAQGVQRIWELLV